MLRQKDKLLLGVKQLALFGAVLGLVFGTGAVSFGDASASGNDKIYICYKDKDKKIKEKDLNKYLKKGATLGKCHDDGGDDDRHGDDRHDDDKHDDDRHDDDKKFKKHKVFTGDGPPPKKLGKKGDLYFDTWDIDGLEYYVKIEKKVWEFRGILVEVNSDCDIRDIIKFDGSKWVCTDDLVEDDDADPVNELQTLSQSGSDVTLSQGGGTVSIDDADADSTNEIQEPILQNRDLSLSLGSTSITLPFALDSQSCGTNEAIIGFDGNGVKICGTVTTSFSLTSVTKSGSPKIIGPNSDEYIDSLKCDTGVVTDFNIIVTSEDSPAVIIESLTLNAAGDTASFRLVNTSTDLLKGDVEVTVETHEPIDSDEDGNFDDTEDAETTGEFEILGKSITIVPQIICLTISP